MIAPSARMMSLASLYPAKTQKTTFSDDGLQAANSGDGAATKITQFQDLREDAGALLFEGGEGVRQRTPPIPNVYIR